MILIFDNKSDLEVLHQFSLPEKIKNLKFSKDENLFIIKNNSFNKISYKGNLINDNHIQNLN